MVACCTWELNFLFFRPDAPPGGGRAPAGRHLRRGLLAADLVGAPGALDLAASPHAVLAAAGGPSPGGGTCGVGFWRRISSVRQAPWIWQRMLSSASIFSYGDMRLLCSLSMSCRMRAYFFSSDCRSACARRRAARSARARRRPRPSSACPAQPQPHSPGGLGGALGCAVRAPAVEDQRLAGPWSAAPGPAAVNTGHAWQARPARCARRPRGCRACAPGGARLRWRRRGGSGGAGRACVGCAVKTSSTRCEQMAR